MSDSCCRNPIGFVRANCSTLNSLIDNIDAILASAGEGSNSGITCEQAITCIQDAFNDGRINHADNDTYPIGGTYDPASGVARVDLSDGNFITIAQWPVDLEPIEMNNGGAVPTSTELNAEAVGKAPGTILWHGGTEDDPYYAWYVSRNEIVTNVKSLGIQARKRLAEEEAGRILDGTAPLYDAGTGGAWIQYVEMDGDDANDGLSRAFAKQTFKAAYDTLPSGQGTIEMGPGRFDIEPMTVGIGLKIRGAGTVGGRATVPSAGYSGGTVIRLVDGGNGDMFASRASGEFAYAHHLQFENISFDANRENQDGGVYDILHIDGGGYNCELRNVSFRACTGWAIHCKEKLINFVLYDVTGTNCGQYPSIADGYDPDLHGGFIYFDYNLVAGSDTFAHYGGQLDSCGRYPYFFSHNKEIGGSHIFDSIELEGVGGSGTHGAHIAMVGYQTNNTVATDPLGRGRSTIWIRGVRSDNVNLSGDPTVPDPTALVHVIAGDTEPDIIISDIRSSGTNILYQNDPLGITVDNVSSDNYVAFWTNSGRVWAPRILLTGGVYANDAAAGAAGLVADDLYKDGSGHIKYKL